jgi:hypothetical protein
VAKDGQQILSKNRTQLPNAGRQFLDGSETFRSRPRPRGSFAGKPQESANPWTIGSGMAGVSALIFFALGTASQQHSVSLDVPKVVEQPRRARQSCRCSTFTLPLHWERRRRGTICWEGCLEVTEFTEGEPFVSVGTAAIFGLAAQLL